MRLRDEEQGQALILLTLAMLLLLGLAAFAIDVAGWYQMRHQAQVAADSSALAAANCLSTYGTSGSTCTSTSDTTHANLVATTIANANNVPISAISYGSGDVTVTTQGTAPTVLGGEFNLTNRHASASAVAALTMGGVSFSCVTTGSNSCISLFAANTTCPSSSSNTSVGLDLVANDSGGGNSQVPYAYSNAYIFDGASSNSSNFGVTLPGSGGSPTCTKTSINSKNETATYTSGTIPYPAVFSQPTCDAAHTSTYWSTSAAAPAAHQIGAAGTYCVSGSAAPSCTESASGMTGGYFMVDESSGLLTSGGAYEFVGPCMTLAGATSAKITSPANQPLFYGTANIVTAATTAALPTCTAASNAGTAGSDMFIDGNGASVGSPIFDQCGSVEITQNNTVLGFIEAWNVLVDKNNTTVNGNGSTSPTGGGTTVVRGGDNLTK